MNKPILALYGLVIFLFGLLVVFTSRWTIFEADALRHNPLNQRELLESLRIPRGAIYAADGSLLARSRQVGGGDLRTYTRVYPPAASPFAHVLGYSFARTGQAVLERERNDELTWKTSDVETVFDQLTGKQQVGNDVRTTLDPKAQKAALDGLAGRKGAVVALDPRTGAIKAMASFPGYDPSALRSPARKRALDADNTNSPLFNRATQSAYAPGSTFKFVTAIAALDSGRFTPASTFDCKSPQKISGVPFPWWDHVEGRAHRNGLRQVDDRAPQTQRLRIVVGHQTCGTRQSDPVHERHSRDARCNHAGGEAHTNRQYDIG